MNDELLSYIRERTNPGVTFKVPPRVLKGGFVNDVYSFELEGAPEDWSGRLVLRLYNEGTDDAVRESCAQEAVASQGAPAPRVIAFDATSFALGRPFMIMPFLQGRPQMVIEFPQMLLQVPRFFTLPRRHAKALATVAALDAAPLRAAFEAHGIDGTQNGWLDRVEAEIGRWKFEGLRPGLEWLRANQPEIASESICHGDLFGANILEKRGRITGIIDWNLATIAEPAYDLGAQLAAYEMSAVPGPIVIQWVSAGFSRLLAWGFRWAYRRYDKIPRELSDYYAARRAFMEMTFKLGMIAEARATGVVRRMPTWRPDQCARYFRRRTGVALTLPR